MGIRIHVSMGWGLTNIKSKGYKMEDDRFVTLGQDDSYYEIAESREQAFYDWVLDKKNTDEVFDVLQQANGFTEEDWEFKDKATCFIMKGHAKDMVSERRKKIKTFRSPHFITYNPEYGSSKIMLFTPLEHRSWQRYDDTMDYYMVGTKYKPYVLPLIKRCGIYPYDGFVRIPGTKPANPEMKRRYSGHDYNHMVGRLDERCKPLVKGAILKDLTENYRPSISDSLLLFSHFIGIFTDWKSTVQELRPMIYRYWG